ncbi:MAG: c(7)-type cytochrome triheme domain-containing protein [Thermodesulfobacteriota bacterium]
MVRWWRGAVVAGAMVVAFCASSVSGQEFGLKKKRPKPHEYGNVVMNNASQGGKVAPVVFNHWLHRARYTCRLCHVDIGFGMRAGQTEVREADNINGLYCGACHDGKEAFGREGVNAAGARIQNCDLCHSQGKDVSFKVDFYEFKKPFPQERFGNGIDWLKAEEQRLVTLKDFLPGVSIERNRLKAPETFAVAPKEANMPEIIFSHQKHTVWSGCELCHPEIFGVKKGSQPYSMQEIFAGRYCGVCHGKVAFPNNDCQRCHTREVQ